MGDPIANYALGKQMRTSCVWERRGEADAVRGTQIGSSGKKRRTGKMKIMKKERKRWKGKCIKLK